MSRYRKVDPRIWNDEKFRDLGDQAKLVFFMLLTHPNMTAIGAMRGTLAGLAEELGWTPEAFREAFADVLAKGMAEHDQRACLIALPKFIKYNPPESPNVVKAWANALDLLPECDGKNRVIARAVEFAKGLTKGFAEALPEAFAKAMAIQEQEQEQKQEQEKTAAADAAGGKPPANPPPAVRQDDDPIKREVWHTAKALCNAAGLADSTARGAIGKLVGEYGLDAMLEAVRAGATEKPVDPIAYLRATCQHVHGHRRAPNKQEKLENQNRAIAAELAREMGLPGGFDE